MSDDEGQDELVTEEMLWDRIPEVQGEERANTYYELSARIFARGQYDEALALAEPNVTFLGRLGSYQYLNMDQVVGQALSVSARLLGANPART